MKPIHELEVRNMLKMAADALDRAYAPYSHFRVGVCLKGATGAYYLSANFENASSGATVCAERGAFHKAIYEGERHFDAIAILSEKGEIITPCGICRQVMGEFCDADMPVICGIKNGEHKIYEFGELYPAAFNKSSME